MSKFSTRQITKNYTMISKNIIMFLYMFCNLYFLAATLHLNKENATTIDNGAVKSF